MNLSVHEKPRGRESNLKSAKCEILWGSPHFKPGLMEINSSVILPGVWATTIEYKNKEVESTTAISSELLTILK